MHLKALKNVESLERLFSGILEVNKIKDEHHHHYLFDILHVFTINQFKKNIANKTYKHTITS